MIELYSRTIQLQTASGKTLLCDPDRLQEELRKAFRNAGIKENWPADQVLAALKEETVVADALVGGSEEENLDQLLVKLLVQAGYPEVATEFARQREMLSIERRTTEKQSEWDRDRIAEAISKNMIISAALYPQLAKLVISKLQSLGFKKVSDGLILQIAEHTLNSLAQTYRSVPADSSGWLMPSGYWEAFFSGSPARLMASGALKIHPVSDLFPVLRLSLNAETALQQITDPHSSPDTPFPEAWEACIDLVVETVAVVVKETSKIISTNQHHPILVNISAMDKAIQAATGRMAKKKRQHLADQAVDTLGKTLKSRQINAIVSLAS